MKKTIIVTDDIDSISRAALAEADIVLKTCDGKFEVLKSRLFIEGTYISDSALLHELHTISIGR